MYGLPADTVRRRYKTKVVPNNTINPVYDEEPFLFKKVSDSRLALASGVKYCYEIRSVTFLYEPVAVGNVLLIAEDWGDILPYISYLGICCCEEYGFQPV